MTESRILILGDSTSMTVGLEHQTYPYLLARMARWPEGTTFVNASLPGFTSADACAFYFHESPRLSGLRAVILFLGDCDALATELPKGRYTAARALADSLRGRMGIEPKRTSLHNRLLPYEWNDDFDAELERPETPADYEDNLRRVIKVCLRRKIRVVLVRARAHRLFPPGVGKGNFVFYRYLGLRDRFGSWLKNDDPAFERASRSHDQGDFGAAMSAYRAVLEEGGSARSVEYPLLVANNYAVAAAEAGALGEAGVLFDLLLKERAVRREIVLFNAAQLAGLRGDAVGRETLLDEAYEADNSLYRIRRPYVGAIDRLAEEFGQAIRLVDMHALVPDTLFVDHCHPLAPGQERLARAVGDALDVDTLRGSATAEIENRLYNPELALGNRTEFYAYFKTFGPYDPDQIAAWIDRPEGAPDTLRYARQYLLKHPFFADPGAIAHYRPRFPSDVGRFPEYFVIRHTIPYLRLLERTPELREAFNDKTLLRSSDQLLTALPPDVRPLVESDDPAVDREYEPGHVDEIVRRVRGDIASRLQRGPQVYERMKTTLYWYFRETLRFGAHSRPSMRYERIPLEYAAESLAMALVIDRAVGGAREKQIRRMVRWLEGAAAIHERYSASFALEAPLAERDRSLEEYAAQLRSHAVALDIPDPVA